MSRLTGRLTCKACGSTFHERTKIPQVSGICDNCGGDLYVRPDDKWEHIKSRLVVYEEQTAPVLDFFTKKQLLTTVSGHAEVQEVHSEIVSKLRDLQEK